MEKRKPSLLWALAALIIPIGISFSDLRTVFESERLSDLDSTLRSDFEVCNLKTTDRKSVV